MEAHDRGSCLQDYLDRTMVRKTEHWRFRTLHGHKFGQYGCQRVNKILVRDNYSHGREFQG